MTHKLFSIGYGDVIQAEDGKMALSKLKGAKDIGLLVTDWNKPSMNGLELVKTVRSDPDLKDLSIVMLTAEATREAVTSAAQAGVNGYIVKPFTAATLKEKIEKILSRNLS